MNKITFDSVTKKYNDKLIFDNTSIEFPRQGFVSITGPSGRGKSTLINLILGLVKADKGIACLEGRVSVVFQEDRLLPWKNVLDNTILPAVSGTEIMPSDEARKKAARLLSELGLENEQNSMPAELSGGMSRRVSIARALMVDADVYIMDEPARGLDDDTRRKVLESIHKYTDQRGRLLIIVTHNPEEAEGSFNISL